MVFAIHLDLATIMKYSNELTIPIAVFMVTVILGMAIRKALFTRLARLASKSST
ncbi:MAG: hypothetical protein ABIA66_02895 [Candidatus Omnitrophota bacterium]